MRIALSLLTLPLLVCALALGQSTSSDQSAWVQKVTASPSETVQSTILGCLAGKPDSFRLTEKDGTTHLVYGDEQDLKQHVGDRVALVGYADNGRDASASSDNGTPHGLRFFYVEKVADLGSCNKR